MLAVGDIGVDGSSVVSDGAGAVSIGSGSGLGLTVESLTVDSTAFVGTAVASEILVNEA